MRDSNVRVASNIYRVKTKPASIIDGETRELISVDDNGAYFQHISDREALKTACDACSCTCASCMAINDPTEKPWGRIRVDGALIDICKCQRTSCKRFYSECRSDLRQIDAF